VKKALRIAGKIAYWTVGVLACVAFAAASAGTKDAVEGLTTVGFLFLTILTLSR
jgi:hypothetical protein